MSYIQPTMNLRFVEREQPNSDRKLRVLQQAWEYIHSGQVEWRDVTLHEEAPKAAPVVTAEMVNRFLGWRLPDNFCPDGGISFTPVRHGPNAPNGLAGQLVGWPIGTNLLDAEQAKAMLQHVLGG